MNDEAQDAIREFLSVCDAIDLATNGIRKSIEEGSTVNFVQEALVINSAAGFLASAAAMIMDTSMREVQDAMKRAGDNLIDDVMNYLKKDKHDDQ